MYKPVIEECIYYRSMYVCMYFKSCLIMGCGMKGRKKPTVAQQLLNEETLRNSYYSRRSFSKCRTEKIQRNSHFGLVWWWLLLPGEGLIQASYWQQEPSSLISAGSRSSPYCSACCAPLPDRLQGKLQTHKWFARWQNAVETLRFASAVHSLVQSQDSISEPLQDCSSLVSWLKDKRWGLI